MTSICYPPGADWSCVYTSEELDEIWADPASHAIADRAEALAWSTLQALTGYRLSLCPTTLRPCALSCSGQTWFTAPVRDSGYAGAAAGSSLQPYISGGSWYNACGCRTDCSCTSLSEVKMPAEVGQIAEVWLDGVTLDPSAYRVDNGTSLIRTDGEAWPSCQDMTVSDPAQGGFFVLYYPGVAPNDLFRYAAGVLAVEYFKACQGGECRLPSGVTTISRAGITMQMSEASFPGGNTGIPEVDAVIRIYNPFALKGPSRVLSPDRPRGRVQTWGS